MRIQPTVLLLASHERLRRETASYLRDAGYHVRTPAAGAVHAADMIVRDWRDERCLPPLLIPVVTVDLALVQGKELSGILVRVLASGAPRGVRAAPRNLESSSGTSIGTRRRW